ncbi:hypothetical protein LK994_04035 [Ferruginibacter lapsinanis]|uniref:hypothetical protein n=1 Tax=Ferruginibacter lapsinanis TaxID=563172 RepID=UPI001E2C5341|nr:hypothetical protein [Ferruginibacter lapsinanis]UEG50640.1 hypothetical protein LK994_04035 [Ferruginibacter lapsinanis]
MSPKLFCKLSVISGTLIIWIIKWGLRPYFNFPQPLKYILGVAPNLLGAFLLPLGCFWLLSKYFNLLNNYVLKMFCFTSFALLVINEYLQLIPIFGRTFDLGDIAASALGLTVSYFFCSKYLFTKMATYP